MGLATGYLVKKPISFCLILRSDLLHLSTPTNCAPVAKTAKATEIYTKLHKETRSSSTYTKLKSQNKPRKVHLREESQLCMLMTCRTHDVNASFDKSESIDATVNIWRQSVATQRLSGCNYLNCCSAAIT